MKKGLTELVLILDASGSMYNLTKDTIGGFNSMIAKQKLEEGEALVSAVTFNDCSKVIYDRVPLDKVAEMTEKDYIAGGCTALIDAIGGAVHHISNVHKYIRLEDVPEHTLFVITTDGMENASRSYTSVRVKEMIAEKQKLGWEFIFLGANIDAVETARALNIDEDHSVDFHADGVGMGCVMESVNMAINAKRKGAASLPRQWKACTEADFKARNNK